MRQVNRGITGSRVALWRRAGRLSIRRLGAAATFVIAALMSVAGISSTALAGTPPGAPASVTAVAGTNSATVSWQPPTTGDPPTGYVVTALKNGTPQNAVATPSTSSSTVVTGLIGGQGYTFQAYAYNASGDGPPTVSASVTPSGGATTYASTVLADGPSVYYRLGESGGARVADSSGQAHNGSYNGSGVTNGAGGALVGDPDTAVGLTGTSYIQSTTEGGVPVGNAARTAEAWVKTTAGNQTILDFGTGGCCSQNYDFNLRVSGSALVLGLGGGSDVTWSAPRTINDGSWHQVAITTDGAQTITSYLDGQSLGAQTVGLATCRGLVQTTCLLNVGANSFTGTIDEVALYQASLSAGQIGAHFNASGYTRPAPSGTPSATSAANSLTATWTPATATVPAGQPAVQGYVVTAYKGGTVAQNAVGVPGTATTATISGLAGASAYTVQVLGYNQFGYGAPGVSASATPSGPATTYPSTILADAPSLYYRLGDSSGGVTADSSGHGNHGTYSGSGVTYGAPGGIVGDPDQAVALSGGGYVLDPSQGGVPVGNAARTARPG